MYGERGRVSYIAFCSENYHTDTFFSNFGFMTNYLKTYKVSNVVNKFTEYIAESQLQKKVNRLNSIKGTVWPEIVSELTRFLAVGFNMQFSDCCLECSGYLESFCVIVVQWYLQ